MLLLRKGPLVAVDSEKIVKSLFEIDPGFEKLCKTLFGDSVEPADVWEYLYTREGISKMSPGSTDVSTKGSPTVPVKADTVKRSKGRKGRFIPVSSNQDGVGSIGKSDDTYDVVWQGEFSKTDDDKRQAFGWASVVEVNGEPVVDRQGDWISPEELEKAAYDYVIKSRKGGDQHKRDGENPFHASDMIESFVVTPEKIEKMGLPKDTPVGWWVGYKVHNDETWSKIKKGEHTGFSIHGKGKRREVPVDEAMGY